MKERTKEQNDAVKFYYDLKVLNEEMEKYNTAMKNMLVAESNAKKFAEEGNRDMKTKWLSACPHFQKSADDSLKAATDAYLRIIAE